VLTPVGQAVGVSGCWEVKLFVQEPGQQLCLLNDPPVAVAPDVYNRAETLTNPRGLVPGMSEWCQNCHITMHTIMSSATSTNPVTHPVGATAKLGLIDKAGVPVSSNYNSYISSGNLGGTVTTAYLSLVPFGGSVLRHA
jgi:hypothetical protein